MSSDLIVTHCSPTLAGIKTANLFSYACPSEKCLAEDIARFNLSYGSRGIRAVPMRYKNGRALVYIFRPKRLAADLDNNKSRKILKSMGYKRTEMCPCLRELLHRVRTGKEFPHEIGLFLGYPAEDVHGFIHKKGGCKALGTWKVYHDAESAEKIFAWYEKCSRVYSNCFNKSGSIDRLIVHT